MASAHRYDRKVRITLGLLVVLLIAPPALALRGCVSHLQGSNVLTPPHAVGDDQLIELRNGATLFLDRGAINSKVVDWLKLGTDDHTAFEIPDVNFDPGSANPSSRGQRAIAQLGEILRADRQLHLQLIVRPGATEDAAASLERLRAERVKAELRRQGLPLERIDAVEQRNIGSAGRGINHAEDPGLFIVLSR